LHERACYEICVLCEWEDDGQDDLRADEVWGGPNHNLSLTEARRNFREHLNVFRRGEDPRIGGVESPEETRAKRAILEALDFLAQTPSATVVEKLWTRIAEHEAVLNSELNRKIREYEQQADGESSV